jgi:hypothetical protein
MCEELFLCNTVLSEMAVLLYLYCVWVGDSRKICWNLLVPSFLSNSRMSTEPSVILTLKSGYSSDSLPRGSVSQRVCIIFFLSTIMFPIH